MKDKGKNKMKNVMQKIQVLGAGLLIGAVLCACGSPQQGSTSDPAGSSLASSSSMGPSGQAQPESSMPSSAAPASSSVSSSQPTKEVDVEALKAIAEKDTFEIKVVKKEFQKDYFSDISMEGNNALLIQYKNVSDSDLEIKELNTAVLLYDKYNNQIKYHDVGVISNPHSDIQFLQTKDLSFKAGETTDTCFRNNLEEIAGAQILVYSYVTADGTEHVNGIFEEWMKAAIKGNNQALD